MSEHDNSDVAVPVGNSEVSTESEAGSSVVVSWFYLSV